MWRCFCIADLTVPASTSSLKRAEFAYEVRSGSSTEKLSEICKQIVGKAPRISALSNQSPGTKRRRHQGLSKDWAHPLAVQAGTYVV